MENEIEIILEVEKYVFLAGMHIELFNWQKKVCSILHFLPISQNRS